MPSMEYKFLAEVKAVEQEAADGKMRFDGYLAKFDNVDSYGDVIRKGAFANTLKEARKTGRVIPVLEQHGGGFFGSATDNTPIGYYESLKEDDKGLAVEGVLFNTTRGKDMHILLREAPKGAMGQSIGYQTIKQTAATKEEQRKYGVYRYLDEVKLWEGSIVTFPANDKARVENVKTASLFWRQLEELFRKDGFSREQAKKGVSLVKDSTPDGMFGRFLERYGSVPEAKDNDSIPEPVMDGAEKLLGVIRNAKLSQDMQNFKGLFQGFKL